MPEPTIPDAAGWAFDDGQIRCANTHGGRPRHCCTRAGLAAAYPHLTRPLAAQRATCGTCAGAIVWVVDEDTGQEPPRWRHVDQAASYRSPAGAHRALPASPQGEPRYLIWSNQQRMWWRGDERGYTQIIDEAGRYDVHTARGIVHGSTVGGELVHRRTDPVTERKYDMLDEVVVLAPESTPDVVAAEAMRGYAAELRRRQGTHRVGRHQPRNVYRGDVYIGVMFDPVDAAAVVTALNGAPWPPPNARDEYVRRTQLVDEEGVANRDLWYAPHGHPGLVYQHQHYPENEGHGSHEGVPLVPRALVDENGGATG